MKRAVSDSKLVQIMTKNVINNHSAHDSGDDDNRSLNDLLPNFFLEKLNSKEQKKFKDEIDSQCDSINDQNSEEIDFSNISTNPPKTFLKSEKLLNINSLVSDHGLNILNHSYSNSPNMKRNVSNGAIPMYLNPFNLDSLSQGSNFVLIFRLTESSSY